MPKLTKTQIYTNVVTQINELLENSKVSKKFKDDLLFIIDNNIAPKNGSRSAINPPKLDKEGNIIEAYCRFHQRYEKVEDMVMSNGKPKGYCKASISLWNKTNSKIKKLDSQAIDFMANGDFEKAKEVAKKAKELKDNFNKPEFYDYDEDWANFNS